MKEDVAVGQHMDVVVAGVTALWSCGFVRPKYVALGVGNGDYVLPVRGAYKHEAVCLSGKGT